MIKRNDYFNIRTMKKLSVLIKKLPLLYTICALMSIVSCKPSLYFPDRVYAPGFTEKGQITANVSLKPQSRIDNKDTTLHGSASASVDLGYSFARNFAIIGSFRGLHDKSVTEHNNIRRMGGVFNGRKTEIALGYFKNDDRSFIFESFLGYGNGTIFRKGISTATNNFRADYNSYFIQSGFGYNSDNVRLTAGMKLLANHYYRLTSTNPDLKYQIGNNDGNSSSKDITSRAFFFLTPFVNFEVGHKFIMFNIQSGLSTQLGGYRFFSSPFYTTFGLSFRFNAMKSKS